MNDYYVYRDFYPRSQRPRIDREVLIRIANSLKAELDELHMECQTADRAGEDFTELWARASGVFFAYRQIADALGWQ